MKSISYLVLILSGLMVAASIDAVPDPPAVRSDTANVKAPCLREVVVAFDEQRLTSDSACISSHVPIHLVSLPDVKRCSSKATTTSRRHGAFTFAVSDL